jgi:pimeloyl-ACP methyl ester carboxylesterase
MQELIDWAGADPILKQVADPRRVYLVGHSRGAKVASLAAARDTRVAAVCLVDPVDNTVYAPLGPGFPSAAAALRNLPPSRALPVAIVGALLL